MIPFCVCYFLIYSFFFLFRNLHHFGVNASCRLHGSPKTVSASIGALSPLHRLQSLDLMDDVPLTYSKENHITAPILTTPVVEPNRIMTPKRLQSHQQLHSMTNDLATITTSHGKGKGMPYSASSSFDGIGSCSSGLTTATSMNTNGVKASAQNHHQHFYNNHGNSEAATSSNTVKHHHHHNKSHNNHRTHSPHKNRTNDGCMLRHRWQACPELHKAMDGVNYIADHTKKEEESTKVSFTGKKTKLKKTLKKIKLFSCDGQHIDCQS